MSGYQWSPNVASFPYEAATGLVRVQPATSAARDLGIDALRGLAVILMIGANLAPYQLELPFPFWFRAWSSLAAPLFILLSGFMTGKATIMGRQRPWTHHVKRAAVLLVLAATIDVCFWDITPFYHFDVLYLLASLQLIAPLFSHLPAVVRVASIVVLFAVAEPLQHAVGYRSECSHVGFDMLQAWLIDGWFPLSPWLGLGLAGTHLGVLGVEFQHPGTRGKALVFGGVLMATGGAYWYWTDPHLQTRWGCAELFYPPTLGFMLCAIGFLAWAFVGMRRLASLPGATVLIGLGRVALLTYFAHIALITKVIRPFLGLGSLRQYLIVYVGLTIVMWALGRTLRLFWPNPQGFLPKLLLG